MICVTRSKYKYCRLIISRQSPFDQNTLIRITLFNILYKINKLVIGLDVNESRWLKICEKKISFYWFNCFADKQRVSSDNRIFKYILSDEKWIKIENTVICYLLLLFFCYHFACRKWRLSVDLRYIHTLYINKYACKNRLNSLLYLFME